MTRLRPGEQVVYVAKTAGPPRRRYWIYNEWRYGRGPDKNGERTSVALDEYHWRFIVDVQIAGEWTAGRVSGIIQDTLEIMLTFVEEHELEAMSVVWSDEATGLPVDLRSLNHDG